VGRRVPGSRLYRTAFECILYTLYCCVGTVCPLQYCVRVQLLFVRRLSLAIPPPLPPPTEATFLAALQDLRQQPPSTCSLTDAQSPTTPRPSPITSRSRSARGAALATGAVRTWLEERDPASVTQTAADAELTVAHIAAERETERGTHNYTCRAYCVITKNCSSQYPTTGTPHISQVTSEETA
jgi:hypothetical protein